jgi:hypothetical protein
MRRHREIRILYGNSTVPEPDNTHPYILSNLWCSEDQKCGRRCTHLLDNSFPCQTFCKLNHPLVMSPNDFPSGIIGTLDPVVSSLCLFCRPKMSWFTTALIFVKKDYISSGRLHSDRPAFNSIDTIFSIVRWWKCKMRNAVSPGLATALLMIET